MNTGKFNCSNSLILSFKMRKCKFIILEKLLAVLIKIKHKYYPTIFFPGNIELSA